jgi:hypothetical protein
MVHHVKSFLKYLLWMKYKMVDELDSWVVLLKNEINLPNIINFIYFNIFLMTYIGVDYDMSFATSHPLLTMHFTMNDLGFVCISLAKQ